MSHYFHCFRLYNFTELLPTLPSDGLLHYISALNNEMYRNPKIPVLHGRRLVYLIYLCSIHTCEVIIGGYMNKMSSRRCTCNTMSKESFFANTQRQKFNFLRV